MLWRPSHTDTAKAAILGLIHVIKFGNPKESVAGVVTLLGQPCGRKRKERRRWRASAWMSITRHQGTSPMVGGKW